MGGRAGMLRGLLPFWIEKGRLSWWPQGRQGSLPIE
jgi:hypothetical protein